MRYTVYGKHGYLTWSSGSVRRLLFSHELEDALKEVAEPIKNRAGDDHVVETFRGHDRVRAVVKTDSEKAAQSNSENNSLLKAVGR